MKATSPFNPTPWNYYRDNHEARMREYRAFESFRSKGSLQHKPAFQTNLNWPVILGWALCSASAAFVVWLSFKLWSAVVS